MCGPLDEIAYGAAWMELRAQGLAGAPEDRDRAADVAAWLQHWLSQATHDLDPAITAFITACAEKERTVLASATEAPEGDAEGGA
jgi:hypothetical protein